MKSPQNDHTTATITPVNQAALRGFARHSTYGRTMRSLRFLASYTRLLMANVTRSDSRDRWASYKKDHHAKQESGKPLPHKPMFRLATHLFFCHRSIDRQTKEKEK